MSGRPSAASCRGDFFRLLPAGVDFLGDQIAPRRADARVAVQDVGDAVVRALQMDRDEPQLAFRQRHEAGKEVLARLA